MRAFPRGTTGNENARTYTPRARIASAIFAASTASPIMTGTIGWSDSGTSKPSSTIRRRKYSVFSRRRPRSSGFDAMRSSTAIADAVMAGARELLNRYGRDFWRSSSTIG